MDRGSSGAHPPGNRGLGGDVALAEHELMEAAASDDYTTSKVPENKRRSTLTMLLLWISFQASVSIMYTGFLARSEGLTLAQVIWAGVVATATLLAYGYGSATLGAFTGQTHTLLTRTIFGQVGSGIVSLLLIIMGMGWYGFQAYFLVLILDGLFGIGHIAAWSAVFGIVMIFNNLFGFKGVAAYARYIASPLLLLWGLYTIIKGVGTVSSHTLFSTPHVSSSMAFMVMVGLLVGSGMWGNEPDIYRYSKPSRTGAILPLGFGYFIGMMVFPIAGYLMAELSTASEFGAVMKYFVSFSLFGFTALATIIFFINQFALNDGNLYEAINAVQNVLGNLFTWRRLYSVLILGAIGAVVAVKMDSLQNNFFIVAGISAVCVPCATMIMVMDVFVVPRLFGLRRPVERVTPWHEAALINWVGVIALLIGLVVGSYTGGLIPNTSGFGTTNIGFPSLQAWALAAVCYLIGVALVQRNPRRYMLLGYPKHAVDAGEGLVETAPKPELVTP